MDAEATDDIEMEERNEQEAAEREGEEETSFTDDQRRDESILIDQMMTPAHLKDPEGQFLMRDAMRVL